jgi:hypothetical protein
MIQKKHRLYLSVRDLGATGGLLIGLIALYVGWLIWIPSYRWSFQNKLDDQIRNLESSGQPVGEVSINEASQSDELASQTAEWLELTTASFALRVYLTNDILESVDGGQMTDSTDPDTERRETSDADFLLGLMRPIRDRVVALPAQELPPDFKVDLREEALFSPYLRFGFLTALMELDARLAIEKRQNSRAMEDIAAISKIGSAIERSFSDSLQRTNAATRVKHYALIGDSLFADAWTSEQLQTLRQLCSDRKDETLVLRQILATERAIFLHQAFNRESISKSSPFLGARFVEQYRYEPDLVSRTLDGYEQQLSAIGVDPFVTYSSMSRVLYEFYEDPPLSYKAFDRRFVGAQQLVISALRTENYRRLALTGVAMKQYQLANDRWPTSLDDLSEMSLASSDWHRVDGGNFWLPSRERCGAIMDR